MSEPAAAQWVRWRRALFAACVVGTICLVGHGSFYYVWSGGTSSADWGSVVAEEGGFRAVRGSPEGKPARRRCSYTLHATASFGPQHRSFLGFRLEPMWTQTSYRLSVGPYALSAFAGNTAAAPLISGPADIAQVAAAYDALLATDPPAGVDTLHLLSGPHRIPAPAGAATRQGWTVWDATPPKRWRAGAVVGNVMRVLWWPSVAAAAVCLAGSVRARRAMMRERRWQCPACGYDLRGNISPICPECGRPGKTS